MNPEVCAVVITYHPDPALVEHLELLATQVETIVIIDNHSSVDEVLVIRSIAQRLAINLIENANNVGVGRALNQGVTWAKEQTACEFILFFDQDSSISATYVADMVAHYRVKASSLPIFLVVPLIVDRRTGGTSSPREYRGRLLVAQTSGSLMPIHIFDQGRLFKEELFIDYVDYEFCLRLVAHNWNIVFCSTAKLLHEPGNVISEPARKPRNRITYNYSPLRHYYLTRNRLWILRTYITSFPWWALITVYGMAKEMIHVLRFENNRQAKLRMWWRGTVDAFQARLGKLNTE